MRQFGTVIGETRRVALFHPLSKNPDSEYFHQDGTACCLFGHVFEHLDISLPRTAWGDTVGELNWELLGFDAPNDYERRWAQMVQANADGGSFWGQSVLQADQSLIWL